MAVVTIARQFNAGGEPIGQLVAARLGAEYVDHKIIEKVAQRLELSGSDVEPLDEKPGSFLSRLLTTLGTATIDVAGPGEVTAWTPPYKDVAFDTRRAVLEITQDVVREAARTGNAVIVGRASGYVLANEPGALHVFLQAPEKVRAESYAALKALPYEAALKQVRQLDANRAAYVKQVYGHDWTHPAHYHLVIDSSRFEQADAADLIAAAAAARWRLR